jgi:hypothetical protein
MTDIQVENHGTIFLFRPLTDAGKEWIDTNTDGMHFGNALASNIDMLARSPRACWQTD